MADIDWKRILGTVAPTLAMALGGPLAGLAVKTIATKLGVDNTEDAVSEAILTGDPSTLLALKEADNDFKVQMKQLEVDLEEIHAKDRDSARKRESSVGGYANPILAGVVIAGFFATVGYVLSDQAALTGAAAGIVGTLVGYVSAKADQVISYYFGSSKGSKEKTQHMADAMNRK